MAFNYRRIQPETLKKHTRPLSPRATELIRAVKLKNLVKSTFATATDLTNGRNLSNLKVFFWLDGFSAVVAGPLESRRFSKRLPRRVKFKRPTSLSCNGRQLRDANQPPRATRLMPLSAN